MLLKIYKNDQYKCKNYWNVNNIFIVLYEAFMNSLCFNDVTDARTAKKSVNNITL